MVARRIGRTASRSSFVFAETAVVSVKNPTTELALDLAREKTNSIQHMELRNVRIDPTGAIEQTGNRFSKYGFSRLCTSLDIPNRYINQLSGENASLAASLVNDRILRNSGDLMLALDNTVVEGVVGGGYSRLENSLVVQLAAAELSEGSFSRIELEGLRMRLNLLGPAMHTPIKRQVGDVVKGGLDIYNGEDGGASFNVSTYIYRLVCSNGMIAPKEESLGRLVHRGDHISDRASIILNKASDLCFDYLAKLPVAADVILDTPEQRSLASKLSMEFSPTFANRVFDKAALEAKEEGREEISLYNLWNGVTFQSHEAGSIDRSRHIELFASKVLDDGLRLARAA